MINIIFLCYEMTKGMKSFGPKALIPMGRKNHTEPLIIKQIKEIQKQYENTSYKIHVVVGFEYERIIKVLKQIKKINIIKYDNYNNGNSAGAVFRCLKTINTGSYLFIENGIISSYKPHSNNNSIIPTLKKPDKNEKFGIGVTTSDNKAEYLFYDLYDQWPEILFIHEKDVGRIMDASKKKEVSHMFLFEYINYLIESHVQFHTEKVANAKITKILNHKIYHNVNLHTQ